MKTTFPTLLRRELWENRGSFLTTPIAVGSIMLFLVFLALSAAALLVDKVNGQEFFLGQLMLGLQNIDTGELEVAHNVQLFGVAAIFNFVLFIVVFFYLLGALYDDRKDRSILFWKSLPVSDLQTVLSKLVTATLVAPLLMLAAVAVTEILLMCIATALLWNADLSAWDYLWGPADPLQVWGLLVTAYVVQALWMLPVWGWLLLVSAFARSKPFLWAVLPPVFLAIMQSWFNLTQYFRWGWDANWMWQLLGERLLGGVVPMSFAMKFTDDGGFESGVIRMEDGNITESSASVTLNAILSRLGEADLWWGVIIGLAMIVGAIYIRRYRDES